MNSHQRILSCLLLLASAVTACSPSADTPCNYHEDCATPREYCSSTTNLCTVYECIEDAHCASHSRCNLISNTCERITILDMGTDIGMDTPPDLTPSPMLDTPPDLNEPDIPDSPDSTPDRPDLTPDPPDMTDPPDLPPVDTTRPSITSITPPPGSSIDTTSVSWTISFDEPIDPLSVGPFNFFLFDNSDQELPVDVMHDEINHTVTVTPLDPLPASSTYRLFIDNRVRDYARNPIASRVNQLYYPPFTRDENLHTLAMKWAPTVYQELGALNENSRHNIPTAIDYDGDFNASNNLSNLDLIQETQQIATAYYHVAQTPSHYFLTYIYYYPARIMNDMGQNTTYTHDFAGVLLVVEKSTETLLIAEGLRVNDGTDLLISFTSEERSQEVNLPGQSRITAPFSASQLEGGTHYPLYIPSGRHEACNWFDAEVQPPFDICIHPAQSFRDNHNGVILHAAESGLPLSQSTPATSADGLPTLDYQLVPFEEIFWMRKDLVSSKLLFNRSRTYSADGMRPYQNPDGSSIYLPRNLSSDDGSPFGKTPMMWLTQPVQSNDGQWFIDPAWTIPRRYNIPSTPTWSYDYCYNLILSIDQRVQPNCQDNP